MQTPFVNSFQCFAQSRRKKLPYFKQKTASFNLGSIFQINQKNLASIIYLIGLKFFFVKL